MNSPRPDQKFRSENRRNRHGWTEQRLIRDREAPGSNPGPPTNFRIENLSAPRDNVIGPLPTAQIVYKSLPLAAAICCAERAACDHWDPAKEPLALRIAMSPDYYARLMG